MLDAIGAGAHRLSEIAGRIGQPATSLSRPLNRLLELGLVRREQPFGDHERTGKRALYRIDDPFFRLWFRVVAAHRGMLRPAARYWGGRQREWDLVAASSDGGTLLLGEAKWHEGPVDEPFLGRMFRGSLDKGIPTISRSPANEIAHALFVPECPARLKRRKAPYLIFDADDVLAVLR